MKAKLRFEKKGTGLNVTLCPGHEIFLGEDEGEEMGNMGWNPKNENHIVLFLKAKHLIPTDIDYKIIWINVKPASMDVIKNLPFVNAQKMREKFPKTFSAPNFEELFALKVFDFVKVCLDEERFWTQITQINGDMVTARVDNDLVTTRQCKFNDLVQFHKHCIYQIDE